MPARWNQIAATTKRLIWLNIVIRVDQFAQRLRNRLLKSEDKSLLLAKIDGTLEGSDQYTRVNCNGFGRIRVFRDFGMHLTSSIGGTKKAFLRGHPPVKEFTTQVFQLAGCNWRCWYCFVDDPLLNALPEYGRYVSADELLDLYLERPDRPSVIDLSGGQPDLVPEWALWVMEAVERRGLRDKIFVWQDDNLSTDLMWKVLPPNRIRYMASFPKHSRVGCFKGFDSVSFSFNTSAPEELFDRQFQLFRMLLNEGFDMYAYATFTAPLNYASQELISQFVDKLQSVHPLLPLRTIPLKVRPFAAAKGRMVSRHQQSLDEQHRAVLLWERELRIRFAPSLVQLPYEQVSLGRRPHHQENDAPPAVKE